MDYKILGSLLKSARTRLKITQSDIAEKLGVTFQNVSSWERGKSKIDIDTLATLCNIYGINLASTLTKANDDLSSSNEENLGPDERELVADYRLLNENGKEAARSAVHGFTLAPNYKKSSESKFLEKNA